MASISNRTFTAAPRTFAFAAGAVTDPVGAVASAENVTAAVAVFPATSATVTVYAPGAPAVAVHENVDDTNGPPAGALTTSAACDHPAVDTTGNDACAAPEPASTTDACTWKLPTTPDRNQTLVPTSAAEEPFTRVIDTLGAVLSTRTVTSAEVPTLPALSVVSTRRS